MSPIKRQSIFKYALAAGSAVAMLLLREILGRAFGAHYPYQTVWLAVVFSAWYCGIWPSILAVIISTAGVWYWFLPPYESFTSKNHTEFFGMLCFAVFSTIIIALGESNRRAAIKRQEAESDLRKAHEDLEGHVAQRTAELQRAQEAARTLTARLLTLRDEERRHIARGLHDSLGQYLAALKINLGLFNSSNGK